MWNAIAWHNRLPACQCQLIGMLCVCGLRVRVCTRIVWFIRYMCAYTTVAAAICGDNSQEKSIWIEPDSFHRFIYYYIHYMTITTIIMIIRTIMRNITPFFLSLSYYCYHHYVIYIWLLHYFHFPLPVAGASRDGMVERVFLGCDCIATIIIISIYIPRVIRCTRKRNIEVFALVHTLWATVYLYNVSCVCIVLLFFFLF